MSKTSEKSRGNTLLAALHKHLGTDPSRLAVVELTFPMYQRANLKLALDALLHDRHAKVDLRGVVQRHDYESASLAKLSRVRSSSEFFSGPVEYHQEPTAEGFLTCVKRGLYLIRLKKEPFALLLNDSIHVYPPQLRVEIMARDADRAKDVAVELGALTTESRAFRGRALTLEKSCHGDLSIKFHKLPAIARDEIVLPEDVLQRIDRHASGFVRNADRLRAAGRHLRRGILLYGAPGTGKTLTAMYLAAQMVGRTVMILTGGGLNAIENTGALARALAPATIVLEDVDLIGTEREHQSVGANALLFELLNQMDGLSEDADVLFLLTTNRPDVLEPALVSRPGRIDQAIEVPLPDGDCRRRLIELYGRGLDLRLEDSETVIRRTEGVSAAFMRELLRKAALLAAEESEGALVVRDAHVRGALDELLLHSGLLTQRLLGVRVTGFNAAARPDEP